jgi:signal transduction histidine kinase/CheY-like chemotaxis protein
MGVDCRVIQEDGILATLDFAARPDAARPPRAGMPPPECGRFSGQLARAARLAVEARDPQRLLQQVPQAAVEALRVEQAVVYLLDDIHQEFRVAAAMGLLPSESIGMRIPYRHEALAREVVAKGHAMVVTNDLHRSDAVDATAYGACAGWSALAVPLFDGDRVVGVVAVCARRRWRVGIEDVRFLETLSSLLAARLQRAHGDEALAHSQGLKSIGQLTGGIAHDFNNLLTVISGNLQMLENCPSIEADEDVLNMVAAAARAARRGAELAGKLLAFSSRLVLHTAPVDAGALLHPLADVLARTLDHRIRVTAEVAPDCPPCLADAGQLESALLNLAINARDAMRDGGVLSFRAWPVDRLPCKPDAYRPSSSDAGYVAIAVSDTGGGMSDAVKQRALEPFFTTKEAGRGTGLGLSMVFGFAEQSHGALVLESTLGRGTTITLFLPQHRGAEVIGNDLATPASVPPGLRVLLVEDDAGVRDVAQKFLVAADCEATACANAEQAMALLAVRAGSLPFDLLLTDIALGAGMLGTDLARETRRLAPAMPVLFVSGIPDGLPETASMAPMLRKPYSRAALARAIMQAMR